LSGFPFLRRVFALLIPKRYLTLLAPRYGLIAGYDETGKLVKTMHDPTGNIAFISEALEYYGYLYLGSYKEKRLVKCRL